jgi:hypothetical protein
MGNNKTLSLLCLTGVAGGHLNTRQLSSCGLPATRQLLGISIWMPLFAFSEAFDG